MSQPTPPTADELLARIAEGLAVQASAGEKDAPSYEPGDLVCSLTLDQKQAWLLLVLLAPYREADADSWDIYLAAWDMRRRVAEAMGHE